MSNLIKTEEALAILNMRGAKNFSTKMKREGIKPKKVTLWWNREDIEQLRDDLLPQEDKAPNEVTLGDIHHLYVKKMHAWVGKFKRKSQPNIPLMFPKTHATQQIKRFPNKLVAQYVYDKETFLHELDEKYTKFLHASLNEEIWVIASEVYSILGLSGTYKARTVRRFLKRSPHILKVRTATF